MKNKSIEIDNKIIVIGGTHHNMLGVVRSLGIKGIKTTAIITDRKRYSFVAKSKYINKAIIVEENKRDVLGALISETSNLDKKAIIVPTSDFAAELIDESYDKLKEYCILPSINKKQGELAKCMNKYNQFELAQKYGIKTAKSYVANMREKEISLPFKADKYILKPVVSADGVKSDIRICKEDEINALLVEFKNKGYSRVLVQEYLNIDAEWALVGCIHSGEIIIPGIMKKKRIYPLGRGSTSYARIEKTPEDEVIEKIKEMLIDLKYSGIFDIDIFVKNNKLYLNEINFRNGANTFAYCKDNIFLIYLWIRMVLGLSIKDFRKTISGDFSFIDERSEFRHLVERNISIREYLRTKHRAKARLLHYKKDIRPSIYKVIYAIKRRIIR